ncbi:MAG: NAD(P)/FAD-dependent oxidoreductase [Candidatus Nanoarchaeia archaeon]|jgi:L-2-hydroxyglutarate oxidase LhgO|nr:NAD(P)/FAD-dependent oxidoreductase [Candidatus Nanoarchaeia archaeon]|tara:strand:- start:1706 stop:2776 length:1071 start_codon:yes stop_codon:yes gene_type:complete
MSDIPITVIGGGVIGCAIAYELSSDYEVLLIEKNQIPGENQSSRNSGVIHAGIYYEPDSLKARLCVEGNKLLYDFCEENDVPYSRTGKLIVATNTDEEKCLESLLDRANENGVPGVELVNSLEYEPNVSSNSALYVPTSGIVDPASLVNKLKELSTGANFLDKSKVVCINENKITLDSGETFETDLIINAAGLYAEDIAKLANPQRSYGLTAFRGEAAKFYTREDTKVSMNVYPVPRDVVGNGESFQTLGVHLTPTFDLEGELSQTVTIGPYYVVGVKREDYSHKANEQQFLDAVLPFFPNITLEDISLHQTGIQMKSPDHDFIIERDNNVINLIGIDSPGLTSALAIAKHVKRLI